MSLFRNESFVVPGAISSVWVTSTAATNLSFATVLAYVAISSGKTSKPCPQAGTSPGSVSKRVAQLLVETGGCMSAVIGVLSLILVRTVCVVAAALEPQLTARVCLVL